MKTKQPGIILVAVIGIALAGGLIFDYIRLPFMASIEKQKSEPKEKTLIERIAEARQHSEGRKGVYMTYEVAADSGSAATRLRENILSLIKETELNAVVIDVKETKGTVISKGLKNTVEKFKNEGIWTIARMTMMRDDSQMRLHPEFYIKRADGSFWLDNHKHAWFDPSHRGVLEYSAREIKKAIDIGFDEIQYDYVRFPSDGNMRDMIYPAYDSGMPKYIVIKNFLQFLHKKLKAYKPEIILSADLFGYVALQAEDLSIGQRLTDVGDAVDYISLMVYPSHYYAGFYAPKDFVRNLAAIFIPYKSENSSLVASSKPYDIIYRSMLTATDVLSGNAIITKEGTYARATSTPADLSKASGAKMRPWLQDFDLGVDKARGIYYDAAKVRAQIKAAEDAGTSGWLLWNPSNVYTKEALRLE